MELYDIEEENREFHENFLNKEGWESNEPLTDEDKAESDGNGAPDAFILENTFAATGITPWYIGKLLKDTVRNDIRVCLDLFMPAFALFRCCLLIKPFL